MQSRARVLRAIEEFLYDLCLLIVFYPWYLLRLIVLPKTTLAEFRAAMQGGRENDLIVSPFLFLVISAAITTLLLPPVDLGNQRLFASFAKLFSTDATIGRLAATIMPVLLLAICNALLLEWRTPGGVSRKSFQLPLLMSVLVTSVLLIARSLIAMLLKSAGPTDPDATNALLGVAALVLGLGWFLYAQSQVFTLLAGSGRLAGLAFSLLGLLLSEAIASLLPQG